MSSGFGGSLSVVRDNARPPSGVPSPNTDDAGFPKLAVPARRALAAAGYTRLDQLTHVSEAHVKTLHGMGPTAIAALRTALADRGLSFRDNAEES